MPNMFSLIAKDTKSGLQKSLGCNNKISFYLYTSLDKTKDDLSFTAGLYQMMSQGTADLLLDVCTDFWDGNNLCPLSDFERLVSRSDLIFLLYVKLYVHQSIVQDLQSSMLVPGEIVNSPYRSKVIGQKLVSVTSESIYT